jgi:hypothetical protein
LEADFQRSIILKFYEYFISRFEEEEEKWVFTVSVLYYFGQTTIPGQTWELTLFSHGNNNNKNKKNDNPHPNSPRRGCTRVMKFACTPQLPKGFHS